MAEPVLDLMLSAALVTCAVLLLAGDNFLRTALLFVVFGVCMALAWVRLWAPDIALAEAAMGAGVTGVLLVDAIRHLEWEERTWGGDAPRPRPERGRSAFVRRAGLAAGLAAFGGLLLAGVLSLADRGTGLAAEVAAHSGDLEHPVTAVLLVFRGFDTWLELGILLLAVLAMLAARARQDLRAQLLAPPRDRVLEGVVRVLAPLSVLTAGYFVWQGTAGPGGAFQSGVVLGATGILLWLAGHPSLDALPHWGWRLLAGLGFAAFTLVGLGTLIGSERMLAYPEPFRMALLEGLEVAAAVSIGACLTALFIGQHPGPDPPRTARTGKEEA